MKLEIEWDHHDQIPMENHHIFPDVYHTESLQASCVSLIDVSTGPSDASSAFSFENILRKLGLAMGANSVGANSANSWQR